MQNTICLTGRLTKDPESKNVSGKQLVTATIAVDKKFKKTDGDSADFFDLAIWSPQQGDFLINYGGKGRLIAVSGRMESRKYTDQSGGNRVAWTVNVSEVSVLDRPRESAEGESQKTVEMGSGNQSTTSTADDGSWDPFS